MAKNIYIFSIEGNIGSGKSTIVKKLKETNQLFYNYNVVFLQEPVHIWESIKDKNGINIIEHYYKNNKKYAFPFQMMAYISRIHQLRETIDKYQNDKIIIITERSVFTDKNVFAQMLYDKNDIEDIEFQIYNKWFHEFINDSPIYKNIYIKTQPDTCLKRILSRKRKGEDIPLDYLQKCHSYHENWLNAIGNDNLLTLDGNIDNKSDNYTSNIDTINNFIKSCLADEYDKEFDKTFLMNHPFF